MHMTDPGVIAAAVLTSHWHAGDMEAVVLLLAEIATLAEGVDVVTGMLLIRDLPIETVHSIIRSPWQEAS